MNQANEMKGILLEAMKGLKTNDAFHFYQETIMDFEEVCHEGALKIVNDSKASEQEKKSARDYIEKKFNNDIKPYPDQQKRAILDGQDFGPIATNAGIAVNALCDEMLNTANHLKK